MSRKPGIPAMAGAVVAGLVVGWLLPVAKSSSGAQAISEKGVGGVSPARPHAGSADGNRASGGSLHTYARLRRNAVEENFLPPEAMASIQRMDSPSLRELLLTLRGVPSRTSGQSFHSKRVADLVARELVRRDAEGTLKWAEEGAATPGNEELREWVYQSAVCVNPTAAWPFVQRSPLAGTGQYLDQMALMGYGAAAARGAEAMLELERLYPDVASDKYGKYRSMEVEAVAQDFDFARFFKGREHLFLARDLMALWGREDSESALLALRGELADKPQILGTLGEGIACRSGQKAAAEWLAAELGKFQGEDRARLAACLSGIRSPSPDFVEVMMPALLSAEDRQEFAVSSFTPSSDNASGVRALKMLASREEQIALLSRLAADYAKSRETSPEYLRKGTDALRGAMDEIGLPEDGRRQVFDVLGVAP